jgi:hypothetical protein
MGTGNGYFARLTGLRCHTVRLIHMVPVALQSLGSNTGWQRQHHAEKAVGFLFIPFYNFYWIFKAWYGFAQDYNRYIERNALNTAKLPEGLFLAFCILFIGSMVPFLNYLAGLPFLVIFIITANKTIDAVNSLLALQVGTINK